MVGWPYFSEDGEVIMPFNKTYEQFCDEMVAVKRVKEGIDDDFFVDYILKLAHELTIRGVNSWSQDEDRQEARWNELKRQKYFDYHFGWMTAADHIKRERGGDDEDYFRMFSKLKAGCNTQNEQYFALALDYWKKYNPLQYV